MALPTRFCRTWRRRPGSPRRASGTAGATSAASSSPFWWARRARGFRVWSTVSRREKLKWVRMRDCVSGVKYMSELREMSRFIREIGASCTRSLRPKITDLRRSPRNIRPVVFGSKYFSRYESGMSFVTFSGNTAWRAVLSASSSTSVA